MPWTDILVHIDDPAGSAERIGVAARLARQQGARLTGMLVTRHGYPLAPEVAAAREGFERTAAAAGVDGSWRGLDGSAAEIRMPDAVIEAAQGCDLLVLGQGSLESSSLQPRVELAERALLESGRPVLVVPASGAFPAVGERILVAWKSGPEWVRAVSDALPLLAGAQRVELLARMVPGHDPTARIRAWLERHGVRATAVQVPPAPAHLGDAILNRVFDEGFDLLLTGASAHGSEDRPALGTVARHLLGAMTVPVLLSR